MLAKLIDLIHLYGFWVMFGLFVAGIIAGQSAVVVGILFWAGIILYDFHLVEKARREQIRTADLLCKVENLVEHNRQLFSFEKPELISSQNGKWGVYVDGELLDSFCYVENAEKVAEIYRQIHKSEPENIVVRQHERLL